MHKCEMLCFTLAWGIQWGHKGPHNQLWGPTRPRKQFLEGRWGQQPLQVGTLGVSLLLTKLLPFIGATMAKLCPSFSFASVSSSQTAPGTDQTPNAGPQQGLIPSGDAPHQQQERLPHANLRSRHPVFCPYIYNKYSAGVGDGKTILHP